MVRRGVLLDVAGARSASTGSTPATRSPSPTSRRPSSGRASTIGAGDVVLVRTGWGQHFDDGDGDTFRGLSTGVPGVGEAGATWLADHGVHAVGADTIAFERLAPGRRPRPAARPPGAARRARHLHRRDDGARGAGRRRRSTSSCSCSRRCRSSAPPAPPSARSRWSAHDASRPSPSSSPPSRLGRRRTACPTTSRASVQQRVLDVLGLCVAAHRLPTSAAAIGHVLDQGGHPQATVVGVPTTVTAAQAAFANGVLAHSLDYDDTHLPSVLHPSASVVPGRARRGRARRRDRRADRPRDRGRSRGRRTPRHGRVRRASSATRSSSSTASTPPRSPARWAPPSPRRCSTAPTRRASSTRSG